MANSAAAIEKQKLVYIMNRDTAARLTISSPLEAHKVNEVASEQLMEMYSCTISVELIARLSRL